MNNCIIKIEVLNTQTGETEKPNRYNTFWDEFGNLKGMQSYLKVVYTIQYQS